MAQPTSTDSKANSTMKQSQSLEHQTSDSLDAPPPSYPQAQAQASDSDQLQGPPSYDKTAYPPLPHHTQAPTVTLYLWYESWCNNDVHILDTDHATTLYTMKLRARKPQMTIDSTTTKATIATVNFAAFSREINATVNGALIPLTPRRLLKNGHTWSSPILGNAKFTWKLKGLNIACEDEQGTTVARLTFRLLSLRKSARLDLYGPEVTRVAFMEELLVTGLASVEYNAGLGNVNVFAGVFGEGKK